MDIERVHPNNDSDWSEDDWKAFLEKLVSKKIVTFKEAVSLVLGHVNPPQVGTSVASNPVIQSRFPKRGTWQEVLKWFNSQSGVCADCGTRLELQVDHIIPIKEIGEDAQRLENLTLRCRRCNVSRRPSHRNGRKTHLTTEAALMWIYFAKSPKTYQDYKNLCRDYGLTMADIRIQEAWTINSWLNNKNNSTSHEEQEKAINNFFSYE